jgi:radical SAM protein with 4Fe4S-binding SPASM domain
VKLPIVNGITAPEEVKIRLLQPCDLKCGMCWHWQDPEGKDKRLGADLLAALFEELGALGTSRVKFTGGEPTLRADLAVLVAAARRAGLRVTIATNAFSLTPARARSLVDAGADTFHVSLDAGVADVHDAIRGVPRAFARTIAALAHLRDEHPRLRRKIATVVQRRNIGHLSPLVALAALLGVPEIYLLQVHTEPWCASDRPPRQEYARFFFDELPQMLEEGRERGVRLRPSPIFEELLGLAPGEQARALRAPGAPARFAEELDAYADEAYGRRFYARHACAEIQARAEIAETGDVYPCCHTEIPELSMGNVRDEPFAAIWARARYQAFRDPEGPLPRHARCLTCKDAHYAA